MSETPHSTPRPLPVVFEYLRAMPYYQNMPANATGHRHANHEDAIEEGFIRNGYTEYDNPPLKKSEENNENFLPEMPPGTFVKQPYGSQGNPDFFIKGPDTRLIAIEAKSFQYGCPMWNSHVPKPNYYYLLCSKKYNRSTICLGSDLFTDAQRQLITEFRAKEKERVDALNAELLLLDENNRGIVYYSRLAIQQRGGKKYADYFIHESRQSSEDRCFASLSS